MNFYALDSETGRLMMIDLTECNDGFQPIADLKRHIPIINICWQGWRCDGAV